MNQAEGRSTVRTNRLESEMNRRFDMVETDAREREIW